MACDYMRGHKYIIVSDTKLTFGLRVCFFSSHLTAITDPPTMSCPAWAGQCQWPWCKSTCMCRPHPSVADFRFDPSNSLVYNTHCALVVALPEKNKYHSVWLWPIPAMSRSTQTQKLQDTGGQE